MNRSARHRQTNRIVPILCAAMIVVMLTQPVMAAFPADIGCDGACCCCQAPDGDATVNLRGMRMRPSDCCAPEGATSACHMSTAGHADVMPALIRVTIRTPSDAGQWIPGTLHTAICPASITPQPVFWTAAGPPYPLARLYLRTCRLIC